MFTAIGLILASAAAMLLLSSAVALTSVIRYPISAFAEPGIAMWWLILGGPFQVGPQSSGGLLFTATGNTAFWLLILWLPVALLRLLFSLLKRRHSLAACRLCIVP